MGERLIWFLGLYGRIEAGRFGFRHNSGCSRFEEKERAFIDSRIASAIDRLNP